ncbi:MAG: 6-phosphogluconolactonase [Deltaproteobacteria bacterium]|nr:6-phosphogluconolactonase [Deltaproteobacteria bacterium]
MQNPGIKKFVDRQGLAVDLAERIAELLSHAVERSGEACLAVSGGSTPAALFDQLSQLAVPWEKVVVTLVDERWVAPDDADSNEHLVRSRLLQNRAAAANFVGLKTPAATAAEGEAECKQRLAKLPHPYASLVLGMGKDGHTASLFPGAAQLAAATDMMSGRTCMAVTPPAAPHDRMTLTLPAILDARRIFLHITGQEKWQVLQKALQEGPAHEMPIRFILRQQTTPVVVFWGP